MSEALTILVIHAERLLRECLCRLLQDSGYITTSQPPNGDPPLPPPHVVVLSASLPHISDTVGRWRSLCPHAGILLLASDQDESRVLGALRAGAIGCILTSATPDELIQAVRSTANSELTLPRALARRLILGLAEQQPSIPRSDVVSLSEREREVLSLLAEGRSNKDIAQALYLSVRTVEGHLASIYTKLGVRNRTEAALLAVRDSPAT